MSSHGSQANLTSPNKSRTISWRSIARVAAKMDKFAQAAPLAVDPKMDSAPSYATFAKEAIAATPRLELAPRIWLPRLSEAAGKDATVEPLGPGTYMVIAAGAE